MKERNISLLLYSVLAMVSISYFPGVLLTPRYSLVNAAIGIIIVMSLYFNFSSISIKAKNLCLSYLYFGTLIVLFVSWIYDVDIAGDFLHLPIAFACYFVGLSHRDTSSQFVYKAQIIFCFFALVMGIFSVFLNGGFVIQDQYAIALKNSSGAILGSASIILMSLILKHQLGLIKYVYGLVLFVVMACLFTFRNRSTMVGVLISFFIMISKGASQMRRDKFLSLVVGTGLVAFVVFYVVDIPVERYIFDSFFANKNTADIDDVSSGRISMIKEGWKYVMSVNPISCNLAIKRQMGCIDCFPISIYNSYGVWGILYYAPAYFYLFYYTFKRIRKMPYQCIYPYLCMLTLLISSLFEASWPFSPGTSIFASYFFCGIEDHRTRNLVLSPVTMKSHNRIHRIRRNKYLLR